MTSGIVSGCSSQTPWTMAVIPIVAVFLSSFSVPALAATWDGKLAQYGEMRKVLGEGRHEGRVRLGDMTTRPHCYAVGALARLAGEVTIVDGQILVTRVGLDGQPAADCTGSQERKATMLVAAYVPSWTNQRIPADIPADTLERFLCKAAREAGLDVSTPFPFMIEGTLIDLEGHVINGACPMRAKRLGLTLPHAQQPFHRLFAQTTGRLVGIYAAGAEHRLTHHGTETHTHALLKNKGGQIYTVHVERTGVRAGAMLRLPTP